MKGKIKEGKMSITNAIWKPQLHFKIHIIHMGHPIAVFSMLCSCNFCDKIDGGSWTHGHKMSSILHCYVYTSYIYILQMCFVV